MMGVVCYVGCCGVSCVVGVGPRVGGGGVSDPAWGGVLRWAEGGVWVWVCGVGGSGGLGIVGCQWV